MKKLIWKLILPLTVISLATITKWWYALPVDAPDTLFSGFPFPFVCDGWHTSLSLQFFLAEFFTDFLIYFLFWFVVVFCINRFLAEIKLHKILIIGLWAVSILIICIAGLIGSNSNNIFYLKRPFDVKIIETGYKFVWQQIERPDYYKYHPEKKEKIGGD